MLTTAELITCNDFLAEFWNTRRYKTELWDNIQGGTKWSGLFYFDFYLVFVGHTPAESCMGPNLQNIVKLL